MSVSKKKTYVHKEKITKQLYEGESSPIKRYMDFFVGLQGIYALLKFEFITVLFGTLSGALGLLSRKKLYPCLFKRVGRNVLWGRNIALRHPTNIVVGDNVAVDDNCILDARGAGEEGIKIGEDVVIARDTIVQGKCSWVKIGNRSNIGSQCQLSSAGGIELGNCVGIAGQCYIGGGRYGTEDTDTPMMDQGPFSQGPVIIGDDVWVGAGAIILDGVRIGKGCFIGAGAVISDDIEDYTIVAPYQKLVKLPRKLQKKSELVGKVNDKDAPKDPVEKIFATELPEQPISGPSVEKQIEKPSGEFIEKPGAPKDDKSGNAKTEKVKNAIYDAVDEINMQVPKEQRVIKSGSTVLFISSSSAENSLDSLGILNFVVATEQKIEEQFGVTINLADDQLILRDDKPFRSIQALTEYISQIL